MIYPFSLQFVGILVGLFLILTHGAALAAPDLSRSILRVFPRSKAAGAVLLVISAVWSFWLVQTVDLGEFSRLRNIMLIAIPIGAVLSWFFVDEFLAVRSLGILALLVADPLLEAAFLRDENSRLLLVCLAYAWIFAGLFLVGMPYLLRDGIAWLTANPHRFKNATLAGFVYGALVLASAITLWH